MKLKIINFKILYILLIVILSIVIGFFSGRMIFKCKKVMSVEYTEDLYKNIQIIENDDEELKNKYISDCTVDHDFIDELFK